MEDRTTVSPHDPVCAICEGPLENAHLLDSEYNWICTPCDIAENARERQEDAPNWLAWEL